MSETIDAARRHDSAFNAQDAEARAAAVTPDIESVLPGGMHLRGVEQVAQVEQAFWRAMPDGRINVDAELAIDDVVVNEGTLTGTHTGPFTTPQGDIPPSGNAVNLRFASLKWIRDGRVAREHLYYDQLEFLQQIGAMPGST